MDYKMFENIRSAVHNGDKDRIQHLIVEALWAKIAFKKRILESDWDENESGLYQHALNELKLAGLMDKDSDYEGMLAEAVLEIVKIFARQGHSGMSASITIELLEKLLKYETLTPITDDPSEWMNVAEHYGPDMGFDGKDMWQSRRNPAMFSEDGGKTHYHVDHKDKVMKSEARKNGSKTI
jgi:hypothetical protein